VYPGGAFDQHLIPFTEGAFDLEGETGMAAAVMPYYTISFGQDTVYDESVGNAYSRYVIGDLLRDRYGYEGVVCTDWGVTRDHEGLDAFGRTPWGAEHLTEAERHYKILMAGVDQFGGNNASGPVIEAYALGVEEHGEASMRDRFEQSAVRLLRNIFRPGLFENPYLDVEQTTAVVGNPDFMAAGYDAQLRSLVLLKNRDGALPLQDGATVWIPQRYVPESQALFGGATPAHHEDPLDLEIAGRYFDVAADAAGADAAIVVIEQPTSGLGSGYSQEDVAAGGNGYMPISLQYGEYTAEHARDPSIAGGDPLEDFTNRTFRGKTVTTSNATDLEMVLEAREVMGDRPVIVVLNTSNPVVMSELEPSADAIVVSFGVQDQAVLDILAGAAEPSGLLPMQMPASMRTVEEQLEDVPLDMTPYVDAAGHAYDFAYGMSWSGVIDDERTATYRRETPTVGDSR
jgi:beta-glucosidase